MDPNTDRGAQQGQQQRRQTGTLMASPPFPSVITSIEWLTAGISRLTAKYADAPNARYLEPSPGVFELHLFRKISDFKAAYVIGWSQVLQECGAQPLASDHGRGGTGAAGGATG